ncbi:DUF6538 domain-containing protein [uncultured Paracoccus sp.]|uniref:DUF6538 domain-containing protein n=1 Tax=uncultured Paracoccus sp. TaxID=189685 RepID=UPI00338E1273
MTLTAHLVRRAATYCWRRRLHAALGAKVLLISLRTSDPARARRLGPLVTAESNRAFDDFAAGKADYEAVWPIYRWSSAVRAWICPQKWPQSLR